MRPGAQSPSDVRALSRILLLLSVLLCFPGAPILGQQLRFNGIAFDQKTGGIELAAGGSNRAEVELTGIDAAPGGTWKVNWELRSPEGRASRQEDALATPAGRSQFALGPLAAPPRYDFEGGRVFQEGYRLSIHVTDPKGRRWRSWSFYQEHGRQPATEQQGMGESPEPQAQRIRLVAGSESRIIYNPRFGSLGPLSLRLGESVLFDQDQVEIQARLNPGETPLSMTCRLRITAPDGREAWSTKVDLLRGSGWQKVAAPVRRWASGRYEARLLPVVEGREWPDGPALSYNRLAPDPKAVKISPFAPWKLERDLSRDPIEIVDFRAAAAGSGQAWRWVEGKDGRVAAASNGDYKAEALVIRPGGARGFYALFARYEEGGGFLQAGRKGLVRHVQPAAGGGDLYVEPADLTGEEIRIPPSRDPKARLVSLRLVPVTAASVEALNRTLRNPPTPLYSVNDWAEYFGADAARLLPDQFQSIVCTESEIGFRVVGWSIGRSWVEYQSKLPGTRTFPCVPYEQARKSPHYPQNDTYDYGPRITMMNQYDPLAFVYEARQPCKAEIWPWLGMQRHYSENFYGGMFSCPFYRENPQWRRVAKDGRPGGVSFYFPEVRKERVDILMEAAERGADGLIVGCDRQVPMLLYEPALVKEFQVQTGIDSRKIDATQGEAYERWIRFRAGFFTQTLRELGQRLTALRSRTGRKIPVAIRIPSGGLFLNLAQGLDVETWCREGLVDQIHLDPLEELGGEGNHDVRPYVHLAGAHGIPVVGAVGPTAFMPSRPATVTAGLKRARGLHRAGLAGIDTFETEIMAWAEPVRFAVALYGHPEELARFLDESNLEAVYPVDAGTAAAGHDYHSVWRPGWTWSLKGFGGRSL